MPGKITGLVVQKNNKERVNVFIDGEFAFGLALIEAAKLRKGQELTAQNIEELKALDEVEVAQERALNFLSYRPRSTEEIRRKLKEKKFSDFAIETIIERLERNGLLNDREFAQLWLESRNRSKPRSARAMRYELRQKGISDNLIDEVLDDLDEDDAAYRAGLSKLGTYSREPEEIFRKRMGAFLQRRGFSWGIIRDVLNRLWDDVLAESESSEG